MLLMMEKAGLGVSDLQGDGAQWHELKVQVSTAPADMVRYSVALALARLSHRLLLHRLLLLRLLLLLLLTHRVDLSLQIRAILVHCRPLIYERASNL